jgi:1,4-dihydroxy-2-naphthoyl-CoA hydrolase
MFETSNQRVLLRDTDAAGIVFFASYYAMAHDCYEQALAKHGLLLGELLKSYMLPIAHSEANYFHPLKTSQMIKIQMGYEKKSERSFSLKYRFLLLEDQQAPKACAELKTVHVHVVQGKSSPLPQEIISFLEQIGEYQA